MSRYLIIIILILQLTSCGDSLEEPVCDNDKSFFSTWASNTYPVTFLLDGQLFNTNIEILFGAPPCNDGRGDFLLYAMPSGRVGFANCADSVVLDAADWSISCNTLKLIYDSDGEVETFN